MVGYNGNFVYPLEKHHQCPVCQLALRDPLQTDCGHRICRECHGELQHRSGKSGEIICPVDQVIILSNQVFPDMYAKREVLNLPTYCVYRNNGCQWQGVLREFEDHITGCQYEDIRCPNGCNQRLPKHLIEQHVLQSCPRRHVECEYCKRAMPNEDLKAHLDECDLFPVDCRFNCGALKIPRKVLQKHEESECPNAVGACAFSFCGCPFKGTKDEVIDHMKQEFSEHLSIVAPHLSGSSAKYSELKQKLEIEAKRAVNLEQVVRGQGAELSSIKLQFVGLQNSVGSLEKLIDELKRSSQLTKESLSQFQRKFGPSMMNELDKLKEQARFMEQKVENAILRGSSVQHIQTTLSGASSLPAGSLGSDLETDKRIEKLENQLALQDVQIAELNLKLQLLESTSYDGKMIWKIDNFDRRRQDAIMGKSPSLYSPPFYTSRFGYKMCARIYLNGDGQGKGSHISLFFVVMKGEYDAMLDWPFPCKITLKMLAQEGNGHIVESFRPDPNSSSFRRPSSEMNIASGVPLFASQQKVMSGPYKKSNCIFIQVIVDTSVLSGTLHF